MACGKQDLGIGPFTTSVPLQPITHSRTELPMVWVWRWREIDPDKGIASKLTPKSVGSAYFYFFFFLRDFLLTQFLYSGRAAQTLR